MSQRGASAVPSVMAASAAPPVGTELHVDAGDVLGRRDGTMANTSPLLLKAAQNAPPPPMDVKKPVGACTGPTVRILSLKDGLPVLALGVNL
eukprot:4994068-Pleurochrysis_carterae.AAC.4